MSFRKIVALVMSACMFFVLAPPARADIWNGACFLNVTFNFDKHIKSAAFYTGEYVHYTIDVTPAVDLNPLASGYQPCVINDTPLKPFKRTWVGASGWTLIWTCEVAFGDGTWVQTWYPSPGGVSGRHLIDGSWGNWVMSMSNDDLTFFATMNLTLRNENQRDQRRDPQCILDGRTQIKMTGVMQFTDP